MICKNCGMNNKEGAKFCEGCGKSLNEEKTEVKDPVAQPVKKEKKFFELKKFPLKVVGIAVVVAAVFIIILCVSINSGKTINLNKYLTIEMDGYDGYGTVKASVDWDSIEAKYGKKVSYTKMARKEKVQLWYDGPVDMLSDYVSVKVEKSSGLSNGDEVAYTWYIDDELSEYINCKIKYTDGTIKVSELTEIGKFDAFDGFSIEYSGIAPYGTAHVNYTGQIMNAYEFSLSQYDGLSNGDIITVTINDSVVDSYVKDIGKAPAECEKKFTVEGLEKYLTQTSEINDDGLATMKQQAEDVYNARVAKNWGDDESLESFTYLGTYLLTRKNNDSWYSNNILYLVYKAQVRDQYVNGDKSFDKTSDIYWYIRFDNVKVAADGSLIVDLANGNTPSDSVTIESNISNSWWGTKSWYYYGYGTLDNLYKSAVTSFIDSYNHQDNVTE